MVKVMKRNGVIVDEYDTSALISDAVIAQKRWSQRFCSTSRSARFEHRGMLKDATTRPQVMGKASDQPSGLQLIRVHQGSILGLFRSLEARCSVRLHCRGAALRAAHEGVAYLYHKLVPASRWSDCTASKVHLSTLLFN